MKFPNRIINRQYILGSDSTDCTASYDITLNKEDITVQEFIDIVLKEYSEEWGYIGIDNPKIKWHEPGGSIFGNPHCEYSHGQLKYNIDEKVQNKKIIFAKASDGSTRMDYLLKVEDNDET